MFVINNAWPGPFVNVYCTHIHIHTCKHIDCRMWAVASAPTTNIFCNHILDTQMRPLVSLSAIPFWRDNHLYEIIQICFKN
jgi:hypothetical protein